MCSGNVPKTNFTSYRFLNLNCTLVPADYGSKKGKRCFSFS